VFFYVDDIVLLARKKDKEMEEIKAKLMAKYEMRDLGELHWFLNVKTLRNRGQRKLGSVKVRILTKSLPRISRPAVQFTPLSRSNPHNLLSMTDKPRLKKFTPIMHPLR